MIMCMCKQVCVCVCVRVCWGGGGGGKSGGKCRTQVVGAEWGVVCVGGNVDHGWCV